MRIKTLGAPGTGKTTTLLKYIQECMQLEEPNLERYLICTYSLSQAKDFLKRLETLQTTKYSKQQTRLIGTIHALCYRLQEQRKQLINIKELIYFFHEQGTQYKNREAITDFETERNYAQETQGELFLKLYTYERESFNDPYEHYNEEELQWKLPKNKYEDLKKAYELYKLKWNRQDFSDLLVEAYVKKLSPKNLKFIGVDEFQDVNPIQDAIIKEWIKQNPEAHVIILGDPFQCLPSGTKILTPNKNGSKRIEDVKVGDEVMSYYGVREQLRMQKALVTFKTKRRVYEKIIVIKTKSGAIIKCTNEHHIPALWIATQRETKTLGKYWYVYIMKHKNIGWRIGITRQPYSRLRLEHHVEGMLVIDWTTSLIEARIKEQTYAYKYGIPQLIFRNRGGKELPTWAIEKIFNTLDTNQRIEYLLRDLNKKWEGYIRQQGFTFKIKPELGVRTNVTIECLSASISSKNAIYDVRYEKLGNRIRERFTNDLPNARKFAKKIALEKKANVIEKWFLNSHHPCQMIPACNIVPGMYVMKVENGQSKLEEVVDIKNELYQGYVHDIQVNPTHNYVLDNGVIVGNSIYGFRSSSPSYFLNFEADLQVIDTTHRLPKNIWDNAKWFIRKHEKAELLDQVKSIKPNSIIKIFQWHDEQDDNKDKKNFEKLLYALQNNSVKTFILFRTNFLMTRFVNNYSYLGIPWKQIQNNATEDDDLIYLYTALEKIKTNEVMTRNEAYAIAKRVPHVNQKNSDGLKKKMFKVIKEAEGERLFEYKDLFEFNSLLTLEGKNPFDRVISLMKKELNSQKKFEKLFKKLEKYDNDKVTCWNPCVYLGTIHSSKGLEADVVMLYNSITRKVLDKASENQEARNEEKRIWYVALTRARKNLIVIEEKRNRLYEVDLVNKDFV